MPAESTPHAPAVRIQRRRPPTFEFLETRQLLSTVNVTSFGAVSGDGRDDSGAIIAAMRQASPGDTISIPAGDWNINRRIDLKNNISIVGAGQKTTNIQVADGIHAFRMTGQGNTLSDMHVIGGLLFIDGVGSRGVKNLNILRNYVEQFDHGSQIGTGGGGGAIGAPGSRVDNVTIADNTFINARRGMAMYMWTGDNWLIADNAFLDTNGGIKSNNAGATAHNIRILRNYWSGTSRMGAELQGQVDGFWFQDNFYENPVMSSNFQDNISTFAFSLIYHGVTTRNAHINRNTVLAPQRPDGTGVRLAFEGGNDLDISDNYINGIGTVTSVFMGDSSGGATTSNIGYTYVQNNKVVDAKHGIGSAYGPIRQKAIYRNNGPDTVLSWDINRGRPGPGGGFDHASYGGGGGGGFDADPDPDPTPGGSIPIVSAFVMDATRITVAWTDTFSDEAGFRLERSMDGGKTWKQIYDTHGPGTPTNLHYTDKGLISGTQFWYRVFMYKKDGSGVHSNIATGKTKGQPPTTRPPGTSGSGTSTGSGTGTATNGSTRAFNPFRTGGSSTTSGSSSSSNVVNENDSTNTFSNTRIV